MIAKALTAGDALVPGTMLGKYEVLTGLAVGGMAELYLARASGIEGFQKLVALKRMRPEHARSPELVSMFLDEARLGASLQHANIAQVYDIGKSPAGLFFTMELVAGQDLRQILVRACKQRRKIPIEHALRIIIDAAAGLHAAHCKTGLDGAPLGIVHRDVSPANILVSYDGCVKVIDFGVAKAAHRRTETRAGCLKGKLSYMSPEQCLGEAVDRRSDAFALGIVLYELTTRSRLFSGENEFKIMKRIVEHDVPSPASLCPGYAAELEAVVMKALSRDPADRYQDVQAMQLELERFARTHGLVLSNVRLGKYMRRTFGAELRAFEALGRRFAIPLQGTGRSASRSEPAAVDRSDLDGDSDVAAPSRPLPKMASAPLGTSGAVAASSEVRDDPPPGRRRYPKAVVAVAGGLLLGFAVFGSTRDELELPPAAGAVTAPVIEPAERAEPAPERIEPAEPASAIAPLPAAKPRVTPVKRPVAPAAGENVAPIAVKAPRSARAAPHVTIRARRKHKSSTTTRRKHRPPQPEPRWDRDSPLPPR